MYEVSSHVHTDVLAVDIFTNTFCLHLTVYIFFMPEKCLSQGWK